MKFARMFNVINLRTNTFPEMPWVNTETSARDRAERFARAYPEATFVIVSTVQHVIYHRPVTDGHYEYIGVS